MSLQIAYFREDDDGLEEIVERGDRLHIQDYDKKKHKSRVFCPLGHKLIGKQGDKVTWHYAHAKDYDDDCCRHMGEWHNWWQNRVYDDFLEIVITKVILNEKFQPYKKRHIADMINGDDIVIEFQKSTVPEEVIKKREKFYGRMVWVFGCEEHDMKILGIESQFILFQITGGSLYFTVATKLTFLDFGKRHLLEVLKVNKKRKTETLIYAKIWTLEEFDKNFMLDCLKNDYDDRRFRPGYQFKTDGRDFENCKKFLKPKILNLEKIQKNDHSN